MSPKSAVSTTYVVFLFNGLLSQDDVLYTEFGVMLEHVQLIRLYERELLALDEQRRLHEQRFSPVLSSIHRREEFELLVLPWRWVLDRPDVYDRFGPVKKNWPFAAGTPSQLTGRSSPPTARSSETAGSGWGGKRSRIGCGLGWRSGAVQVDWESYIVEVYPGYKDKNGRKFTTYNILRYQVITRRIWSYSTISPVESS